MANNRVNSEENQEVILIRYKNFAELDRSCDSHDCSVLTIRRKVPVPFVDIFVTDPAASLQDGE